MRRDAARFDDRAAVLGRVGRKVGERSTRALLCRRAILGEQVGELLDDQGTVGRLNRETHGALPKRNSATSGGTEPSNVTMGCMPPAFAIATRSPNSSASAKSAPAASSCAPSPHVPSSRWLRAAGMAAIARLGSSAAGVYMLPVVRRASAADACCLPRLSPLLSSVTSGSRTPSSTL